jgi:hypothetical protein
MASQSVSFRLSNELMEKLSERAKAENKKVSDMARELLEAGLTQSSAGRNPELEQYIIDYLGGFGELLKGVFVQAAMSHYYGRMATGYSVDIQSLMQTANVLDPTEKKNVMWKFEKGSLDQAMQIWKQIEANKSKP